MDKEIKPFKLEGLITISKNKSKPKSTKKKKSNKKETIKVDSFIDDSVLIFINHLHEDIKTMVENSVKRKLKKVGDSTVIQLDNNITIKAVPFDFKNDKQRYEYTCVQKARIMFKYIV